MSTIGGFAASLKNACDELWEIWSAKSSFSPIATSAPFWQTGLGMHPSPPAERTIAACVGRCHQRRQNMELLRELTVSRPELWLPGLGARRARSRAAALARELDDQGDERFTLTLPFQAPRPANPSILKNVHSRIAYPRGLKNGRRGGI